MNKEEIQRRLDEIEDEKMRLNEERAELRLELLRNELPGAILERVHHINNKIKPYTMIVKSYGVDTYCGIHLYAQTISELTIDVWTLQGLLETFDTKKFWEMETIYNNVIINKRTRFTNRHIRPDFLCHQIHITNDIACNLNDAISCKIDSTINYCGEDIKVFSKGEFVARNFSKKLNSKHSIRFSDKSGEKKLSETISTSRVVDRPENINNYLAANITEIVSESKLANLCKKERN